MNLRLRASLNSMPSPSLGKAEGGDETRNGRKVFFTCRSPRLRKGDGGVILDAVSPNVAIT